MDIQMSDAPAWMRKGFVAPACAGFRANSTPWYITPLISMLTTNELSIPDRPSEKMYALMNAQITVASVILITIGRRGALRLVVTCAPSKLNSSLTFPPIVITTVL